VYGQVDTYFAEDEPKCFHDTVIPDEHGATTLLAPSGCALPCPGGILGTKSYFNKKRMFKIGTILSVIAGSIVTFRFAVKYFEQCKASRSMNAGSSTLSSVSVLPVLMFCVGGLLQALINLFAIVTEDVYTKCSGNARYNKGSAMCIVQSVAITSAFMWSNGWTIIIAAETWVALFLTRYSAVIRQVRRWYIPIVLVITTASIVPLHANGETFVQVCNNIVRHLI
jgi:hypothetical protein